MKSYIIILLMRKLLILPVLWYLRLLARIALVLNPPEIIGVAGSVGKSSTRNALYAVLKDAAPTKMISGNSETGVPLGILGITASDFSVVSWILMVIRAPFGLLYLRNTRYLIVEMGIDDPYPPKNMSYLLTILRPDIAISLNISPTHTEQFEKTLRERQARSIPDEKKLQYILRRIAQEDTKIITASNCKVGIYNADDSYIKEQIDEYLILHRKTTLLSFGKGTGNDISYGGYEVTLKGTRFTYLIKGETKLEKIAIFLEGYVLPKEYQEIIATAIITGYQLGIDLADIKTSLERNYSLPKGRSTLLSGIHNSILVDSTYNASPSAVEAFLDLLTALKKQENRPAVFIFGDMRELGDEARMLHEKIARKIPDVIEYAYLVGPLTKDYVLPILKKSRKIKEVQWFPDALTAGKFLHEQLPSGSLILIKGSQNTIYLEETAALLLQNLKDRKYLCRQDSFWQERKRAFFTGLRR
jgi:UDP-N-acetylmuramoyl-tripeptide--D-alanyl-D-alanine ligase